MGNIFKYSEDTLEDMRIEFCNILRTVERPGANIEELIKKLEASDFFVAPASTRYHNAFRGGLVEHSLNVYYNLQSMVKSKGIEAIIPEESIVICGLLHDLSKMNIYEETAKNKKVYCENGDKYDELGRFTWVSERGYAKKDIDHRFVYGNHEETSEYMIRKFIPLRIEESVAILNHHGGMGYDSNKEGTCDAFTKYPLATLLHLADMMSSYVDEGKFNE